MRPGAERSELPASSFALGRVSSGRSRWSSRICQRSTPSTSAVARWRSAGESALTALPRSRSSEWRGRARQRAGIECSFARRRNSRDAILQAQLCGRDLVVRTASWLHGPAVHRRKRIAAQKLGGGHALLAFELHFEQLKPGILGAGGEEAIVLRRESSPARRCPTRSAKLPLRNRHAMHDQLLAIESGECAGPGLKSAPAIVELVRRARGKIHAAIFAVEQRRKGRAFVILRLRLNRAVGQARPESRQPAARRRAASTGNRSTAVCSGPISMVCCSRIGPVSRPSSRSMVVLPVNASPMATAHWIGAAPRYFGSSDPCRLMQPSRGRASIHGGMMRP